MYSANVFPVVYSFFICKQWTLCMKDRKYDKRHAWGKNHSGCLETWCHVRGPLRNKMATLGVIPSRSDSDPLADPVPGQTMQPTVSLTESDIPGAFLKPFILKGSGYVRLCQAYCWQHSLTRNWIGRRITVRAGRNDSERCHFITQRSSNVTQCL